MDGLGHNVRFTCSVILRFDKLSVCLLEAKPYGDSAIKILFISFLIIEIDIVRDELRYF